MSKIMQTTDYTIIKLNELNRAIDWNHVKRLVVSISQNNLLEFCPILLNKKMEILDGQHRYYAAKELLTPIYYQIEKEPIEDIIPLLNTNNKNWSNSEFINYYAKKGIPSYIRLIEVSKELETSISTVLAMGTNAKDRSLAIKAGTFVFEEQSACERIKLVKGIIEFLNSKIPCHDRMHFKNRMFLRALVLFIQQENVNYDEFLRKLNLRLGHIYRCSSMLEYLELFENIYNYRRAKPKGDENAE